MVESLVALVVAGLAASLVIPSLTNMYDKAYTESYVTDLGSALSMARSEALKRNSPVYICALADNSQSCGVSTDWDNGFKVYQKIVTYDDNNEPVSTDDNLLVKKVSNPVAVTTTDKELLYSARGTLNASANLVIKPSSCKDYQYFVEVNEFGVSHVVKQNCSS